jgi:hypothetical protein
MFWVSTLTRTLARIGPAVVRVPSGGLVVLAPGRRRGALRAVAPDGAPRPLPVAALRGLIAGADEDRIAGFVGEVLAAAQVPARRRERSAAARARSGWSSASTPDLPCAGQPGLRVPAPGVGRRAGPGGRRAAGRPRAALRPDPGRGWCWAAGSWGASSIRAGWRPGCCCWPPPFPCASWPCGRKGASPSSSDSCSSSACSTARSATTPRR